MKIVIINQKLYFEVFSTHQYDTIYSETYLKIVKAINEK
tara:strand:- start:10605 stop:10721 length:117 start_codon:yes stop_codon:yes gene_type:complete